MKNDTIVDLKSILESPQWKNTKARLPLAIGKDEHGEVVVLDLTEQQHLLIGGATGSGKSVCLNSIILGLLSKFSPDELRFIMADLKVVEMIGYTNVQHLQFPILNESEEVLQTLEWCIAEVERRYTFLADARCKTSYDYNNKSDKKLPYIVFILNEISSLMRNDKTLAKKVEDAIVRICQKGRAAGIHLIISTSGTCKDVITTSLRSHFPAHIAFQVGSADCSKVILDKPGAEKLSGDGDMVISLPFKKELLRCQGAYSDEQDMLQILASVTS